MLTPRTFYQITWKDSDGDDILIDNDKAMDIFEKETEGQTVKRISVSASGEKTAKQDPFLKPCTMPS